MIQYYNFASNRLGWGDEQYVRLNELQKAHAKSLGFDKKRNIPLNLVTGAGVGGFFGGIPGAITLGAANAGRAAWKNSRKDVYDNKVSDHNTAADLASKSSYTRKKADERLAVRDAKEAADLKAQRAAKRAYDKQVIERYKAREARKAAKDNT